MKHVIDEDKVYNLVIEDLILCVKDGGDPDLVAPDYEYSLSGPEAENFTYKDYDRVYKLACRISKVLSAQLIQVLEALKK